MAVMRWLAIVLAFCRCALRRRRQPLRRCPAQTRNSSFANPAEYDSYMAALNTQDPAKRAHGDGGLHRLVSRQHPHDRRPTSRRSRPGRPPTSRPRPTSSSRACCRSIPTMCARWPIAPMSGARAPHRAAMPRRWRPRSRPPSAASPCCPSGRSRARSTMRLRADQGADGGQSSTARWASPRCRPRTTTRRDVTIASRSRPSPTICRTSISSPWRSSRARRSMRWASGTPRARSPSRARRRTTRRRHDIDRYVRSRYRVYRGSEEGWDD